MCPTSLCNDKMHQNCEIERKETHQIPSEKACVFSKKQSLDFQTRPCIAVDILHQSETCTVQSRRVSSMQICSGCSNNEKWLL